jgi:hypothetical protein
MKQQSVPHLMKTLFTYAEQKAYENLIKWFQNNCTSSMLPGAVHSNTTLDTVISATTQTRKLLL